MDRRTARVVTVLGTRPEIIKCSPLLPRFDAEFEHVLVHTGQHYDASMDEWFFRDLGLRAPDVNLAVGSGSHAEQLARMLCGIEPVLRDRQPDIVFVQGDTNSTLAGALAGAKMGLRVVHLEAGCRSFNRAMPEETNRIVVDHIAARCLAPDEAARRNLEREGIDPSTTRVVGSTGVDACLRVSERLDNFAHAPSDALGDRQFLVATIHRAENTRLDILSGLLDALAILSREWPILFPVHPRTAQAIDTLGRPSGVTFLEPVGYPQMIRMLRRCRALLTDSGGLQEEAAVLGTPTFILRNETEWTEFVDSGRHLLVGTSPTEIERVVRASLDGDAREERMRVPAGMERAGAADRVMDALRELLQSDREEAAWNQPVLESLGVCPGDERPAGARALVETAHR